MYILQIIKFLVIIDKLILLILDVQKGIPYITKYKYIAKFFINGPKCEKLQFFIFLVGSIIYMAYTKIHQQV